MAAQKFEIIASPIRKAQEAPESRLAGVTSPNGQYELALGAFEEIGFKTDSIRMYTKQDIVFQKSKTLIHTSEMSLLAKKAVNLCHFLAGGMGDQEIYVVRYSFFIWMLGYNSRNIRHLRKALVEAQRANVELLIGDDDAQSSKWVSVQLLGTAAIGDGEVRFRLPPEMRNELRSTATKAYISMRVQSELTVEHALTIYEIFSGFELPCTTDWMTPAEFRQAIGISHLKSYEDYKALKRSVIDKSLADINAKSDLHVDMESASRGKGRAITHIRFHVRKNENYMLGFDSEKERIAMQERYRILTSEFGLSDKELEVVLAVIDKEGIKKVDDAIEFAQFRIAHGDTVVKYPGAFLMSAIAEGRRLGAIERQRSAKATVPAQQASNRIADAKASDAAEKAQWEAAVVDAKRIFVGHDFAQHWAAFAKSLPGQQVLTRVDKDLKQQLTEALVARAQAEHSNEADESGDPALLSLIDRVLENATVRLAFGLYLLPHLKG